MSDQTEQMKLNIPSDFKYLGAVDAALQDLAREFAFSEGAINDVSTALVEACSNAIEHGNRFDKDKRVRVTLTFNGSAFRAEVNDEGAGFDYGTALRRDDPPNPMSERGRGLIIMKAFTDDLRFSLTDHGLCVELTKTRELTEDDSTDAD